MNVYCESIIINSIPGWTNPLVGLTVYTGFICKHTYIMKFNIFINEIIRTDHNITEIKCRFMIDTKVECFDYLLLGSSVISLSFIICMLSLLLMPLAGLHFCVGLDFVTPSL
jgi:hypothetical protein